MLHGKLISAEDGTVISGANARLLDGSSAISTTVSDEMGNFSLSAPTAGQYRLLISHLGFIQYEQQINLSEDQFKSFTLSKDVTSIEAISISSLRAKANNPSTRSNLSKNDIQLLDQSKDFPFLLNITPSTVISSDAGNGVGYTGIRIRGIDPTRVNVTINDIPLNDAEGQGVFWVDLPDLASSTGSVQVQRGVGTSTNGVAAFGASVNVQTDALTTEKILRTDLSAGSFNTQRLSLLASSGRFMKKWAAQGRLSLIRSDGFIDRASSDLQSGQFTIARYDKRSMIKANVMLGHERTYQAWWGIPQPKYKNDEAELNRYISQLWITGPDLENLNRSDSNTYNYYTYKNEVDDYTQNHFQLFYHYLFPKGLRAKVALHYTRGKGYFEQYLRDQILSDYGISPNIDGQDTTYISNVVRRRWLDNHFYGTVASVNYQHGFIDLTIGGAYNEYRGRHFGEAIQTDFTEYEGLNAIYYDNDAFKTDGNSYAKIQFDFGSIHPYLDLQLRWVKYSFFGLDDQADRAEQTVNYQFANPKFGLVYRINPLFSLRGMYAVGNREPVRDDLINSTPQSRPGPETLEDIELGIDFGTYRFRLSMTAYQMNYTNALILTGEVNDVGAYTRINVEEAYRKGLEFGFASRLNRQISAGGNITFSENIVPEFTEYIDDWTNGGQIAFKHESTSLAFSPKIVSSAYLNMKLNSALSLDLIGKYVGDQYLDNTESEDRKLDAFNTLNMAAHLNFQKLKKLKLLQLHLYLNNITGENYAPNGYTFSGQIDGERESFNYVYPMAGFNWMLKLSIELGGKKTDNLF